jgi:histidine triad (HIT) family protein
MTCPFCSWQQNPSLRAVLSSDLVLFLQHSDPTPKGAGIVIPARHADTVFDLTPAELAATHGLLREVKAWMEAAYRPDGYTIGWSGAVGGQEVMHARQEPLESLSAREAERRWKLGERTDDADSPCGELFPLRMASRAAVQQHRSHSRSERPFDVLTNAVSDHQRFARFDLRALQGRPEDRGARFHEAVLGTGDRGRDQPAELEV